LADRIGRKRVIYLLTPLWYTSNLLLAFSTGPVTLVLYAVLQAFYTISTGVTNAMSMELVPVEQQGRWSGLLGLFSGLVTIPAPIIGGVIWRELGPVYVFLIPIALDLALRVPLLSAVPETLREPSPAEMRAHGSRRKSLTKMQSGRDREGESGGGGQGHRQHQN
jgi:MFS family permease